MTTFTDDFNRANNTNLGASWVEVSGDWSIVSNHLSPGSAGGTIILRAAGAMSSNDNYAQATIAATAAVSHGVWCRGDSNIANGYLWRNDGTSWNLFSVVGGSFTSIGSYAAAAVAGDVAKVQAVGSTIKGYVNGVQRVSVTDTAVTTGTNVGIRSESSGSIKFDDFSAGDVTAGATLGIASATETAQPLTGAKTATLSTALATEAAQPVTGAKTAALGIAAATETAQPLATSKTALLGTALETAAAQPLTGTKTALLPVAAATETALSLTAMVSRALSTATSVETAQPLTGAKSATLTPALEINTARPLSTPGASDDVDVTVGAPYSPWAVGEPEGAAWPVGVPH